MKYITDPTVTLSILMIAAFCYYAWAALVEATKERQIEIRASMPCNPARWEV
jgi:hypothetical protein